MATNDWTQNTSVKDLRAMGQEFNFFQALRLLESSEEHDGAFSALRMKGENSAAFKANFIEDVQFNEQSSKSELNMTVNGFNLCSQNGPLPDIFSELLYREEAEGNRGPNDFINIFNDRLLHSLFEMKKIFNPMLFNGSKSDYSHKKLFEAVSGLPTNETLSEKFPQRYGELWKTFSVALANRRINYSLLRNILTETLGIRIKLEPCEGSWRELPKTYRAKLGSGLILGAGGALGRKYWDHSSRISLQLFVDSRDRCLALLPGGAEHQDFCRLASALIDGLYEINVEIVLLWEKVSNARIEDDFRLGQTSWLKTADASKRTENFPKFVIKPSITEADKNEAA